MRKLKEQMRWSEVLVSITNECLVESETLFKERLELEKEWPAILQAMQDMEKPIREAYQEFIFTKECSHEVGKIKDAEEDLKQLRWKRDGLKVSHVKRNEEICVRLQLLTKPVIDELTDVRPITGQMPGLLHREINNLPTKRIFTLVREEDYENEYGRFKKAIVKNNLSALEQAEKLLLATMDKIRGKIFSPVSEILDILDEAQDAYLAIDFGKCSKDEFSLEDYQHIIRTQGESSGTSDRLWPWEIAGRVEEAKIFEKEIAVKEKVGKVFAK